MKLTAYTLASSSKGNSVFVSFGTDSLLIDAGISCKKIETAMKALGADIRNLGAILITHEHSDHIQGLPTISKKYGIPIHMTEASAHEMLRSAKYFPAADFITVHPPIFSVKVGGISVSSFVTPHDSVCSVGYLIRAGEETLALATDIGHISDEVHDNLTGADSVILESNHDENMLLFGSYPYDLKRRILSDRGHLSNENAADFAYSLALTGTKRIVLAHLSPENNIPELALETSLQRLRETGCEVVVAEKDSPTYVCGERLDEKPSGLIERKAASC